MTLLIQLLVIVGGFLRVGYVLATITLLGVDVVATLAALLHLGNEVAEELREHGHAAANYAAADFSKSVLFRMVRMVEDDCRYLRPKSLI